MTGRRSSCASTGRELVVQVEPGRARRSQRIGLGGGWGGSLSCVGSARSDAGQAVRMPRSPLGPVLLAPRATRSQRPGSSPPRLPGGAPLLSRHQGGLDEDGQRAEAGKGPEQETDHQPPRHRPARFATEGGIGDGGACACSRQHHQRRTQGCHAAMLSLSPASRTCRSNWQRAPKVVHSGRDQGFWGRVVVVARPCRGPRNVRRPERSSGHHGAGFGVLRRVRGRAPLAVEVTSTRSSTKSLRDKTSTPWRMSGSSSRGL